MNGVAQLKPPLKVIECHIFSSFQQIMDPYEIQGIGPSRIQIIGFLVSLFTQGPGLLQLEIVQSGQFKIRIHCFLLESF